MNEFELSSGNAATFPEDRNCNYNKIIIPAKTPIYTGNRKTAELHFRLLITGGFDFDHETIIPSALAFEMVKALQSMQINVENTRIY